MIKLGMNDGRDSCEVRTTAKEMLHLLSKGDGYKNLNETQRAGVYLLCRELSALSHDKLPHKFQNLAYVLGVIDAEDIKKTIMESLK